MLVPHVESAIRILGNVREEKRGSSGSGKNGIEDAPRIGLDERVCPL
jgi:hypothetical protein